jgi:hypothetical protein
MVISFKIRIIACALACIFFLDIGKLTYVFLFPEAISQERLPILNMAGQNIVINNHGDAVDPSYNILIEFLSEDATENKAYVYPVYTCGDFASRLHDEAEKRGIKCGIVGIKFNTTYEEKEDMSEAMKNKSRYPPPYSSYDTCRGHAFNAFNTTDGEMVYVDSTGITVEEKEMGNRPYDMIVYAIKGEELGEICVDQAESLDYSYYKVKEGKYLRYLNTVGKYNSAAELLNREIETNSIDSITALNEKRELEAMRSSLERCEESRWIIVGQMGIIDYIQVFW